LILIGAGTRTQLCKGAGLLLAALLLLLLLVPNGRAAAAEWSNPQRIATQLPLEDPARLTGVSCPADNFCAASDTFGNVVTATAPMGIARHLQTPEARKTPIRGLGDCAGTKDASPAWRRFRILK
jgi:hypothetical protein